MLRHAMARCDNGRRLEWTTGEEAMVVSQTSLIKALGTCSHSLLMPHRRVLVHHCVERKLALIVKAEVETKTELWLLDRIRGLGWGFGILRPRDMGAGLECRWRLLG